MKTMIAATLFALCFTASARILTEMETLPAGETADGMSSTDECPVMRVIKVDTETDEETTGSWWLSCDPNTYPEGELSYLYAPVDPFALPQGRTDVAFQCYQLNRYYKRCYWITHGALQYFDYYWPV